ncbi:MULTISPECIES: NUDIX domain-containing protein [unclassified Rhizobium]
MGETWQEAGVREVREETGVLSPKSLIVSEVVTGEK